MIEIGDKAPSFHLEASRGRTVDGAELQGRPYLLYFYPKADTPGCTTQACGIQEALPQLQKLDLTVIGVSPDPVDKIDAFADKFTLSFPLASDLEHKLADQYGVWVEKTNYGKTYFGIERSSFLIDANGIVRAIWRKVKPAEHAALVAEAAAQL
ncbi:thioredoxin-dependent thiol peroxidase [Kozakia baliensis]|uniref:thioredoxin-dependent thiol peroxidase n=1 Tax=Kozakia baliensis TaxID=153496 RepID=UPI00345B5910